MSIVALPTAAPHPAERSRIDRFREIFAGIAAGAAERDAKRIAPYDQVNALKKAGFGTVRISKAEGGLGLTFTQLIDLVIELGQADSNIAHIFRNHLGAVENALGSPGTAVSRFTIARTLAGETFGGAFSELSTSAGGGIDFSTTFVAKDDGYVLNGTKFYSTGNLYADWLSVAGRLEDGRQASAVIPVGRAGVELADDWDGVGQRLTGSGTTRFVDVAIARSELTTSDIKSGGKYRAVYAQLYLSAVIAGILANVRDDALQLVRGRSRNFYHGLTDKPRDEPEIQELVGQISTNAWLAATIVREAALALQGAQNIELAGGPNDDARMQASIAASRVKIIVDDLGPATVNLLFEAGGGSTVRQGLAFDRHWRNIKTLSAHNPRSYKLRVLGDYELNGTPLPIGPFF